MNDENMKEPVPVQDADVGTAADVEAVMKKYDRESNVRIWEGIPLLIIRWLSVGFSIYCIYVTLFSTALPEVRLTTFLGMILILGYLNYPIKKGVTRVNYMPWYDVVIMVAGSAPFFYFACTADYQAGNPRYQRSDDGGDRDHCRGGSDGTVPPLCWYSHFVRCRCFAGVHLFHRPFRQGDL